jgi:hypothetical protein
MPSLTARLGEATTLVKAVAGLLAAASVLAVDRVLPVPDAISAAARLILAVGSMASILLILFADPVIKRMSGGLAAILLLLLSAGGIAGVLLYEGLRQSNVRVVEGIGEVVVPIYPSASLQELMNTVATRYPSEPDDAFTNPASGTLVRTQYAREAWKTRLGLLALLLGAQVCIFLGILGSVWRLSGTKDEEGGDTGPGVNPSDEAPARSPAA